MTHPFRDPSVIAAAGALIDQRRFDEALAYLSRFVGNQEELAQGYRLLADLHRAALVREPRHAPHWFGLVSSVANWSRRQPAPPAEMAETPPAGDSFSVIICSIDGEKERRAVAHYQRLLEGCAFEIVVIRDARSLCEGYNRGVRHARGEILIFSHDDIEILSPAFVPRLSRHLQHHDLVGVAGTSRLIQPRWVSAGWPYLHGMVAHEAEGVLKISVFGAPALTDPGAQALDGCWFACRRSLLERIRFDEEGFDGFHFYDLDFSFAAHLAGRRVAVCNDILALHGSPGHMDEAWWQYRAKFAAKYAHHFATPPEEALQPHFILSFSDRESLVTFSERMAFYY
ncbi:MAG: glycosyltransferase [Magnetococcales bacterium]|nr:glycosyltransferase [Magnetococcales bacterium]